LRGWPPREGPPETEWLQKAEEKRRQLIRLGDDNQAEFTGGLGCLPDLCRVAAGQRFRQAHLDRYL
jgi:hypothetical protein